MAGLNSAGFSVKRLQEVRDEISGRLQGSFGEDINTEDDSVFGQVRDSVAPGEATIWEQLQIVYDSQSPSRAEGQQLDDNTDLVAVFRKKDKKSTVRESITGDNNTIIPVGFKAEIDTTKSSFENTENGLITNTKTTECLISVDVIADSTLYTVTLDGVDADFTSDGTATEAEIVAGLISEIPNVDSTVTANTTSNSNEILIASVDKLDEKDIQLSANLSFVKVTSLINLESTEFGAIEAPLGQLTVIKTAISGLDSIANREVATLGVLRETDPQLRSRRDRELAVIGSSSVLAIRDRVNQVSGVRTTVVLENFTDATDGNGLVPHSINVVTEGGADTEVAEAIFATKPVGTDMNGSVSVAVTDSMGISRNILFDRPTEINIYIEITLTKFADYPSNGDTLIKEGLEQYGLDFLFSGDDVITSRLYTPINAIQGHQVDALKIGITASPTTSTPIAIDITEIAKLNSTGGFITII